MATYTERLVSCLEQRQSGELTEEEFDDFYPHHTECQKRTRHLPKLEFPEGDRAKQLALTMRKNESIRLLTDALHESIGEEEVQQRCSKAERLALHIEQRRRTKPEATTEGRARPRTKPEPRQGENAAPANGEQANMYRCVSAPSLSRRYYSICSRPFLDIPHPI